MAEWDTAYINDLPDSAFAYVEPGEKDEEGRTTPRSNRHFPHHDASGALDLPHLRNALSRGPQSDVWPNGEAHLQAHAKDAGVGKADPIDEALDDGTSPWSAMKAAPLEGDDLTAWFEGRRPRRLLAIPFHGPIDLPDGRRVDVDVEYFSPRTDIKADWFEKRPTDWHHGRDPSGVMNGVRLGYTDRLGTEDGVLGEPDENGWWVDLWMKAGEARLALIERIVRRGGQIFGSTYAYPPLIRRGKAGHIDVWPYMVQTLSTSPQNTHSILRPAKAVLEEFDAAEITVSDRALREMLAALDDLRDLSGPPAKGRLDPAPDLEDLAAKAGRELSGANLAELEDWEATLDAILSRVREFRGRVRDKYVTAPASAGAQEVTNDD